METQDITAILAGILRHALTTLAGFLVAHGWLANDETTQFIGGGMALVVFGWSWWQKIGQARARAQLKGTIDYLKAKGA